MVKAFIFDMDGVIIASEKSWHEHIQEVWPKLVGPEIASVFRLPIGQTPLNIYEEAVKHGATVPREAFLQEFENIAQKVYREAPFTTDIERLGEYLVTHNFRMGLVSSARRSWIDLVLQRLSFGNQIGVVLSINDHPELKPKPHPGSYIETIEQLGATSDTSIILEDSNSGIRAAKDAGVFTIGLTANLLPEYTQHGADIYANTVDDIIEIVDGFSRKLQF